MGVLLVRGVGLVVVGHDDVVVVSAAAVGGAEVAGGVVRRRLLAGLVRGGPPRDAVWRGGAGWALFSLDLAVVAAAARLAAAGESPDELALGSLVGGPRGTSASVSQVGTSAMEIYVRVCNFFKNETLGLQKAASATQLYVTSVEMTYA